MISLTLIFEAVQLLALVYLPSLKRSFLSFKNAGEDFLHPFATLTFASVQF